MNLNGKKVGASISGPAGAYPMFEARDVTPDGAFLAGSLFLELNEEFTVELSFADTSSLRVKARVDRVERGTDPGMVVSFAGLTEAERKLIVDKTKGA